MLRRISVACALLLIIAPLSTLRAPEAAGPLVIAHRGASGYLPEHTLAAYAAAYFMGADLIEPDVVMTRDGIAICLHDITLDATTNAPERFPDRAREDGKRYAIDFTLAELKTLEKQGRDGNARGHQIATLAEMLGMVRSLNEQTGRSIGVIPEPKRPAWHRAQGMPIERPMLDALADAGYRDADSGAIVQCFELDAIRFMHTELNSRLPMAWLTGEAPSDAQLDAAAEVCSAIGPRWTLLVERDGDRWRTTDLAERAARRGLELHPWTVNTEADLKALMSNADIAGVFTDYPDRAIRVRDR